MPAVYTDILFDFWALYDLLYLIDEDTHVRTDLERWPHLEILFKEAEENRYLIIGKSKQAGVSVFWAAYALWKVLTVPGFRICYISAGKENGRVWLQEKVMAMYDCLPAELSVPVKARSKYFVEFEGLGTTITVWGSTKDPGLGSHYSLALLDEYDFHRFPEQDWKAIEPTINHGGQCIIYSTRNKLAGNTRFVKTYIKAKAKENRFKHIFISCYCRPGRDPAWYAATAMNLEPWIMKESYPRTEDEMLSPIDTRAFFNQEPKMGFTLEQLLASCVEPTEKRMGDYISIFKKPVDGMLYIVTCDCAQGQDGDYQAAGIWERNGNTLDLAAVMHANNIMTDAFGADLYHLTEEYGFPLTVVESNGYGDSVLNKLESMNHPYVYYRDWKNNKRGFYTGVSQRDTMLRELNTAFTKGQISSRYTEMIEEMLYFTRSKGRLVCSKGHDDLVLMAAIAWQVGSKLMAPVPESEKHEEDMATCSTGGMYDV